MSNSAPAAAPSESTGVSATSPVASAPESAPATPETSSPTPGHDKAAMLDRLKQGRAPQEQPQATTETASEVEGVTETAAPEATSEAKKDPESIPMEAFKKRLQDEKRKRESLQQQVGDFELSISKRDQAIDLLKNEVRRLAEALQTGSGWDERDEQIRAYEFAEQVRQLQADLEAKHQQSLFEAQENMRLDHMREQVRGFFSEALERHGELVGVEELRAACKRQMGDNPDLPPEEIGRMVSDIAGRLADQRIEAAKRRVAPKTQPPAPAMVKPSPGAPAGYAYTPNAEGMKRWLAARKQSQ